jgi:hypothetical protein
MCNLALGLYAALTARQEGGTQEGRNSRLNGWTAGMELSCAIAVKET